MNNPNNSYAGAMVLSYLLGLYLGYLTTTPEGMIGSVLGVVAVVAFDFFRKRGK